MHRLRALDRNRYHDGADSQIGHDGNMESDFP
jgi:hypothetical protein